MDDSTDLLNLGLSDDERRNLLSNPPDVISSIIIRLLGLISDDHWKKLYLKRSQLVLTDEYGFPDPIGNEKWSKHKEYYVRNALMDKIEPEESDKMSMFMWSAAGSPIKREDSIPTLIALFMDQVLDDESNKDAFNCTQKERPQDGIEYEHYCRSLLQDHGWKAQVTQSSSDQGCDIIAEKSGNKLVVQCKRYSSPVGNKAVQEVIAARDFYKADYAAVITNASYTKSAIALAKSAGIRLLHDSEIGQLDSKG